MKLLEFFQMIDEAIQNHNAGLWAYAAVVAEQYDLQPVSDPKALPSYKALIQSNEKLFKQLQSKTRVNFTPDDPYQEPEQVASDVVKNRNLSIYSGSGNHPVISDEQNNIFRTVHDFYAHVGPNRQNVGKKFTSHNFTYRGELNAYLVHAKLLPPAAIPAAFNEVVGQSSYFLLMNDFPPQKAAILEGFDYTKLGRMSAPLMQRHREIMAQLNDQSSPSIRINIKGGIDYPKDKINWKHISVSNQA